MDGAAEVEIRGDSAILRNLTGQPPQWRRVECKAPMPVNPGEFRFAGVDGRGSQQLVRDPRNGGSAVVRIEDRDNGSEGYTFDIFWGGVVAAAIVPVRIGADLRLNRIVAASDLRLSRIAALTACLLATIIVTAVLVRIAVSPPIRPFEPARIGSKTKLAGVWELPVSISGAPP